MSNETKKSPVILRTEDLKRSYNMISQTGEKIVQNVLKGITFEIEQGEFAAIMGRSGGGKTTLLKTLGMMDKPNGGKVFYKETDTKNIYGRKLARIRRRELAFVFQNFYLMDSLTVRENIMLPLILDEADTKESIEIAEQLAKRFAVSHLLGKKPYELSGGEKQRVALCRALSANPDLILADEPTGNLDSESSEVVIQAFSEINEELGKTILLVTHDPIIASYCKRIVFLKDGQIIEDLKRQGEREEFYQEILKKM